jgi:hypothetical protein
VWINRNRQLLKFALVVILVGVFSLASFLIVKSLNYADSDFFSYWLAARMTWQDQDPYNSDQWIAGHEAYGAEWVSDNTFIYPRPLTLVLAPLGLLPVFEAYVLWVFLSMSAILGSLVLLRRLRLNQALALQETIPIAVGVLLFRAVLVTVRNGQLGGFLLLLLVFVMHLWKREKWLVGGMILAVTLLKPNLGVPICAFMLIWAVLSERWKVLAGVGLGVALLFALGQFQSPGWFGEYLQIAGEKGAQTLGYSPSVWGLAGLFCEDGPTCVLISGLLSTNLVLVMLIAIFTRFRRTLAPHLALSLVLPAALFVTPYLWAYDQILLLIPIVVLSMELLRREVPYLISVPLTIYCSLGAILLVVGAMISGRDALSAMLSLAVLLGSIMVHRKPFVDPD